jgi:hypothetical protein
LKRDNVFRATSVGFGLVALKKRPALSGFRFDRRRLNGAEGDTVA